MNPGDKLALHECLLGKVGFELRILATGSDAKPRISSCMISRDCAP